MFFVRCVLYSIFLICSSTYANNTPYNTLDYVDVLLQNTDALLDNILLVKQATGSIKKHFIDKLETSLDNILLFAQQGSIVFNENTITVLSLIVKNSSECLSYDKNCVKNNVHNFVIIKKVVHIIEYVFNNPLSNNDVERLIDAIDTILKFLLQYYEQYPVEKKNTKLVCNLLNFILNISFKDSLNDASIKKIAVVHAQLLSLYQDFENNQELKQKILTIVFDSIVILFNKKKHA